MIDIWWPPNEIFYKKEQVVWLLENLLLLREGFYPPDSRSCEVSVRRGATPFLMAALIAAELDYRINMCGDDGQMLLAQYTYMITDAEIEFKFKHLRGMPYNRERRISSALSFCSGNKRKRHKDGSKMLYKEFKW